MIANRENSRLKGLLITVLIVAFIVVPVMADSEVDYIKRMIAENYVKPIEYNQIKGNTPQEIFKNLDKYSQYFSVSEFTSFLSSLNDNKVSGIGIYIKSYLNLGVQITEVVEASPAEKAGLKYGDIILSVNDIDLKDKNDIDGVANLIRGPIGTYVKLTVKSMGDNNTKDIRVKREAIEETSVQKRILDNKIGYIKIKNFYKGTGYAFKKAVEELVFKDIEKLIIDLRGNGGGLLDEAIEACNAIVKTAPIVHIQDRKSTVTYKSTLKEQPFANYHIVVLVDENTASAAEIMALAIKENNLGKVVGQNTVGKGSVQRLYFLESGAGFKLTEAYYLSPNKNKVDGIGVKPDYLVNRFNTNLEEIKAFDYKRDLKVGDKNDDVVALQQRLKLYGYNIKDMEGYYGADTQEAVKEIEKKIYNLTYKDDEYIPLRKFFESIGYKVDWDNKDKSVVIVCDEKYIKLPVEKETVIINNHSESVKNPIKIRDGMTLVSGEIITILLCDGNMNTRELKELNDMYIKDIFNENNDYQLAVAKEILLKVN